MYTFAARTLKSCINSAFLQSVHTYMYTTYNAVLLFSSFLTALICKSIFNQVKWFTKVGQLFQHLERLDYMNNDCRAVLYRSLFLIGIGQMIMMMMIKLVLRKKIGAIQLFNLQIQSGKWVAGMSACQGLHDSRKQLHVHVHVHCTK